MYFRRGRLSIYDLSLGRKGSEFVTCRCTDPVDSMASAHTRHRVNHEIWLSLNERFSIGCGQITDMWLGSRSLNPIASMKR